MKLDIDTLNLLVETQGRNAKLEVLKKLEEGKELLALALDPNVTFGITADEDEYVQLHIKSWRPGNNEFTWDAFYKFLCALRDRQLTGNVANDAAEEFARSSPSEDHAIWFARLINKDLRAGIQLSSLLKVWPGLITPFEVQLALPYDPSKHELNGLWILEPKLDGLRMVIIGGVPYTRNGKVITSVDHIIKEMSENIDNFKDYVFDGEVMGGGAFDEASGKVRKKDVQALDAVYHVFDFVRANEWAAKKTTFLAERKACLEVLLNKEFLFVKLVRGLYVSNVPLSYVEAAMKDYIQKGYEGCMLKDANASYQFKRSKHLLKVKEFHTEDCKVIELIEGRGKYKGMVGAVIVETEAGVRCEVGSGFNDSQRKHFWTDQNFIGSVIEVQYQEKTPDGKLRFPVYLRQRPDKD